jgi:hypothetical protein
MMVPDDDVIGDDIERKLVSEVVSASLDEKAPDEPLIEPVVFTMKTHEVSTVVFFHNENTRSEYNSRFTMKTHTVSTIVVLQ